MTAPAEEVRRPLGAMERWYWICDQISPLNVVARVRLAGRCPRADLARAAAGLALEHPLLRVAIAAEPDGTRPRFVAAPGGIPVRSVRSGQYCAGRWEREVGDVELVTSVDWRTGPLARIVEVAHDDGHDLILTVSHVIADGTTALELLRRLVELAADPAAAPRPRGALPPVEALLPGRVNGVPRPVRILAALLADRIARAQARPRRLAPAVAVAPARRRTRLIRRELSADRVAELAARCRLEGVTVHSAMSAAMAIAVAALCPPNPRSVCVGAPVDFRTELTHPVGRRDAGAYVATVPSYVRVGHPGGGLWAAARSAHRDLRRRRRLREHLALVSLLRLMSPRSAAASARAVGFVDRAGPGNVCLSNLGRLDFPDRIGPWRLSGAQFIAGVSISGYLVAAVNTSHGALHWNFTHIDGAVPGAAAEQIADRAVSVLLSGLTRG
ncbi:hypothetical protein ACIBSW_10100 [Actinoplanes sp. NPDC049668]|uniref:phthiocerol/phthiodiolone dimycocerosyl transferase family protein n=1 Tax=unclassified Actinoplanes TaxID=2626549 RepID=UPI0033A1A16B